MTAFCQMRVVVNHTKCDYLDQGKRTASAGLACFMALVAWAA